MWAFAFWDAKRHRLLLARDRLGIKPLYYYHGQDGSFVFGSEMKALLSAGVPRDIRNAGVSEYLAYGYNPDPDTIYAQIKQLEAGSYLIYEQGSVRISRYWDLRPFVEQTIAGTPETLLELLDSAVRLQMLSDVPIGAFLSGGIDSSAIVASMAAVGVTDIRTFCVSFPEMGFDESSYSRLMANSVSATHQEYAFEPNGIEIIEKAVLHMDEPFADDALLPTYAMCQLARAQVTVALSGDGGDEIFAGYDKYRTQKVAELLGPYAHWVLAPAQAGAAVATRLPLPAKLQDKMRWIGRLLDTIQMPPAERYLAKLTIFFPGFACRASSAYRQQDREPHR